MFSKLESGGVFALAAVLLVFSVALGFMFDRESGLIVYAAGCSVLLLYSVKKWSLRQEDLVFLEKRLKHRTLRYKELLSILPEGVMMLKNGRVEYVNPSFCRHFQLESPEGEFARDLNLSRQMKDLIVDEEQDDEHDVQSSDARLRVRLLKPDDEHLVVVSHDATKENLLNEMRRDFIANAGHELRTPLTVISGFLEIENEMLNRFTEADKARFSTIFANHSLMLEQSARMKNIIEDLLTISKIENNEASEDVEPEVVDVKSLVEDAVRSAQAVSAGRHEISYDAEDAYLIAFEEEIRAALMNLLVNAVRYTPEGGSIRVEWKSTSSGGRISVSDDGIGIAPEHIPRLAERFYRVDRGRSRQSGGTGLGLAIVKHVVKHNKGELSIVSSPGSGSTFAMEFPESRIVRAP